MFSDINLQPSQLIEEEIFNSENENSYGGTDMLLQLLASLNGIKGKNRLQKTV